MEEMLLRNAALNYAAYVIFCGAAWALSLYLYEKWTPYREWKMIVEGNKAAARSMGGVAIGLALPLAALAAHASGLKELALWSAISLGSQVLLWGILSKTALKGLKAKMEQGVEAVGILLGALSLGLGLIVAACVI